jgi:drug/metabolite transporter (DMT)-like permease
MNGGMFQGTRLKAILTGLLVTFLWSTSFVLIKLGLRAQLPALTFAGLRYSLAFLCLVPFVLLDPKQRIALAKLDRREWAGLVVLGLVLYTLTQGSGFVSLAYLPAASLSLLLNLTPIVVGLVSGRLIQERTSGWHWLGIAAAAAGSFLYFLPLNLTGSSRIGLAAAFLGLAANSAAVLLGRGINRIGKLSPLVVTFASMGTGGVLLLAAGLLVQGLGVLGWMDWGIIAWLAVVNTALAFTLWNQTLRTLGAVESSVLNGLMLPQIAVLSWFLLGETLTVKEIAGLALAATGVLLVQIRR